MVKVDLAYWRQTPADLLLASRQAEHPRTRERFLALYNIASGLSSIKGWAKAIGRSPTSVAKWVSDYNYAGPAALAYRRTGGRAPLLPQSSGRSCAG